jgi:phosphate butyryltransferase
MIKGFDELMQKARKCPMKTVAVASAADEHVLGAVSMAYAEGLVRACLVGEKDRIEAVAREYGYDLSPHRIVDVSGTQQIAAKAVELVREGEAQILMKGFLESSDFIRAIIAKETGLRIEHAPIAAVAILEMENADRLIFITDPGFMPKPGVEDKKKMVANAVEAMHRLGIENPKVAMLCATETVNPKVEATVEAAEVAEYFAGLDDPGCVVAGPISFDLAMSEQSAIHKGYQNPVAGKADLLVVPSIETGNAMLKAIQFCGHVRTGGLVTGAKCPIVFSSRSDSEQTKLFTIAIAALTC